MSLWTKFIRSDCFPDCSCEFMGVDNWISQPLAFWSSLAYLLPAYFFNKRLKEKTQLTRIFTISLIVLTFSSMFCHASFIRLAVAFDFASIGLVMGFFPLVRLFKGKNLYWVFTIFFVLQIILYFDLTKWPKTALSIVIFLFALFEVVKTFGKESLKARSLQLSLFFLSSSFLLFMLDDQKIILCDPQGWIHGHTLWHLGTAISAYFYGKWRFIDEKTSLP